MSSEDFDQKLTLSNMRTELAKLKEPFLREVRQTAKEFHEKIVSHKKNANDALSCYSRSSNHQRSQEQIQNSRFHQINDKSKKKSQMCVQQRNQAQTLQPKLHEWKANTQYGFKDYEQLSKNYYEVFKNKQKVRRTQKNEKIEDFRADEREMVSQIFEQIKNPQQNAVQFQSIENFFENYDLFYYYYNIHPYRLSNLLQQSAKKYKSKLSKEEFIDFFLIDRPTVKQFKIGTQRIVCSNSILSEENWKKLKSIFDTLDTFGNEKICVKTFFQRIKSNPSCVSLLEAQAIQFPEIKRIYTLDKVLFDLQNKMEFETKVNWDTIYDAIFSFVHIESPSIDIIEKKKIQAGKISKSSNDFLLEPQTLQIIKQVFRKCPKYCDFFVKTSFFSYELLQTGILRPYLGCPTRPQTNKPNSYLTLQQVIKRFFKEAPDFIDMDEMLQLVSIKGLRARRTQTQQRELSESSDEEERLQRQSQRRLKKIRSLEQLKKVGKKKEKKKSIYTSTKVKQFNLYKKENPTIRQQKVKQMIKEKENQEQAEIKKKFKAHPIPVSLNPQRYQKYAKFLQKKKQSILNRLGMKREKDQMMIDYLKSNTKLFQEKKLKKHCEQSHQKYVYQASPLPYHISQQLLPRIEAEKEERRRQILEQTKKKYLEGYWKQMQGGQSFDKDESLLDELNLIQEKMQFEQFRAKEVPNFQLMHRKFEQQLARRRQRFEPTKVKEFKLTSPSANKKHNQFSSPQSKVFKFKSPPKFENNVNIKSTKKFEDLVAHNQAILVERELQELEKQKEKEQRILKQKNFASFMRKHLKTFGSNSPALKKKSAEKIKNFKQYVKRLEKQSSQQLAQMYARVLQRPFLFEIACSQDRQTLTAQKPSRVLPSQQIPQSSLLPYKQGIFEKDGEQFHPIQSENLNQSF